MASGEDRASVSIEDLWAALDASVAIQSHYAWLLNEYDGGQRLQFGSASDWIRRLRSLDKADEGGPRALDSQGLLEAVREVLPLAERGASLAHPTVASECFAKVRTLRDLLERHERPR